MSNFKLLNNSDNDHGSGGSRNNEEEEEITRNQALTKFLSDPKLNDILLEGTDGIRVPACRCILAARSEVLYTMLFGGFSESQKKVIRIGYEGSVLQALVEYVLTDTSRILQEAGEDNAIVANGFHSKQAGEKSLTRIQVLVSLTGAAMYFNFPLLCQKVLNALSECMKNNPNLALPIFQTFYQQRPTDPTIKTIAMSYLSFYNMEEVDRSVVALLSPTVLEDILKDKECPIDEYRLFQILQIWASQEQQEPSDDDYSEILDRQSMASDLVKYIHLEWIDPNLLSTFVAESGLVPIRRLMETYRNQALAAHAKDDQIFKRARFMPVWERSGTEVTTSLDMEGDLLRSYPPMTSGVHQWTLEVEKEACATWLGIALSNKQYDLRSWLGRQEGVWLLGSNGGTASNAKGETFPLPLHPKFKHGSRITFTLNLGDDRTDGGSLSASINGGESFVVFTNLRIQLKGQNTGGSGGEGFIPAVSRPRRVRLLEITKLRN